MSRQREELDSALEALQNKMRETISKLDPNEMVWIHQPPGGCKRENVRMSKQREALKLALEVLEEINKLSIGENAICLPAEIDTAMDAIREALAEPEQEPVAWMHQPAGMSKIYSIEPIPGPDSIPLYTTPPARKPLTDEEIKNALMVDPAPIYKLMTTGCITGAELNEIMKRVARAIERAHGIGEV